MKMQPGFRQIVRMQQANLLQVPDKEFQSLINEIERSPLFSRMYHQEKLVHYQRFPRTDIHPCFYQLKEELAADQGSLDIESLLSNRGDIVHRIERLGEERFKKYFLFPEGGITAKEIAAACALDIKEVEAINSLVNEFAITSEFYHPSPSGSQVVHYVKIASVEKCGEGFIIDYFSPVYARGRYIIDYGRFEQLLSGGSFNSGETSEAKKLFKKLELINHRKDTINNILQSLIRKQALYLECGNPMSLLPFSQKELARETGMASSSVCRAIQNKSIVTPRGQEVSLKYLLPSPKRFKGELIKQLLQTEPALNSDEATRSRLREKHGVVISRRSVAKLRQELKLPSRGRTGKPRR